jgi:hypothetical protein
MANGNILHRTFIKGTKRMNILIEGSEIITGTNPMFCQQIGRLTISSTLTSSKEQRLNPLADVY